MPKRPYSKSLPSGFVGPPPPVPPREQQWDRWVPYRRNHPDSPIARFMIPRDGNSIQVEFIGGSVYEYTNESTGAGDIAYMQRCAFAGRGLATFISQTVRKRYARKIR
jgi:RimJ/RimL family protein N-acetyltransferase